MNGEVGNGKNESGVVDDAESTVEPEDTVVFDDISDVDNVGDISVEINVEEIIAKIEAGEGDIAEHKKAIRRQLDELEEERKIREELESTFNFNMDDDL